MNAVFYERAWVDPTMFAIVGSYPRLAPTYHDAFGLTKQSLAACVNSTPAPADLACTALLARQVCVGSAAQICESYVQNAGTQIQAFLIALLQNPAPSSLATKDAQLQADLAKADTALLATTDAVLHADAAKVAAGEMSYSDAISAADGDAVAIGNP